MPKASKKATKRPTKSSSKTFNISFTSNELMHMRDLMSVMLPSENELRLSESLLEVNDLDKEVDSSLWQKICKGCEEAGIEMGESAPDFLVGPSAPPPLVVYKVILEEEEEEEAE